MPAKKHTGVAKLSHFRSSLERVVGAAHVRSDAASRHLYSRDCMTRNMLDLKAGVAPMLPDLICWPGSAREIASVMRLAHRHKVPVIPFGGGSGVSGGTLPLTGGVILDVKRLNAVSKIEQHPGGFSVTAESGIISQHLEHQLNEQGFTLGHFPSSILCATLGGCLAARSAGQFSSKYGKIEDMVEDVEVVLPTGRLVRFGGRVPAFPGMCPKDLFVGMEGTLGVITKARLRVYPQAPFARYKGASFNRLQDAFRAIREILQSGLRPHVVRLYDPLDTLLLQHGYDGDEDPGVIEAMMNKILSPFLGLMKGPAKKVKEEGLKFVLENPYWIQKFMEWIPSEVLLILGFEGEKDIVEADEKAARLICKKSISRDCGEKPGRHWLNHRYSVSFKMPKIFAKDGFVDTIEVATTWDRLETLYEAVRREVTKKALLLAHFSHAYAEGCSIYFTFVGRTGSPDRDREIYAEIWDRAMEACLKAGGTISHHHGIGVLKAKYMPRELGPAMSLYRQLKKSFDPNNIMNPGKMGL